MRSENDKLRKNQKHDRYELAKFINDGISSDPCDYCICEKDHCHGFYCVEGDGFDAIVEWLNSEVKE